MTRLKANSKISIIIPVYNVEKYLRQCLDSIIGQTYKNLEIIIVDDGSTDYGGKICDEYAKKDKRIKLIHQKNAGLSAARNAGLKIATGKYIGYIDSDDYVESDIYEKLYNLIINTESDITVCNRYIGKEDGSWTENTNFPDKRIIGPNEALQRFYSSMYVWNKLYKRDIIKDLIFVETRAQDAIYNFTIFQKIKKIACLNECKNYYRYNPSSIVHTKKFKKNWLIYITDGLDKEIEYAEKNKLYSLKKGLIKSKVGHAVYWLSLLSLEDSPDIDNVKFLQKIATKHLLMYLKSKRSLIKKCFAILVSFNFKLASSIYKHIMNKKI